MSARSTAALPPVFSPDFQHSFETLLLWRRDVRRFRADPVPEALVERLLDLACLAPSVGNSQPWRFVRVASDSARAAVRENFQRANAAALEAQEDSRRPCYARLKLEGLERAPLQFAVYCDERTDQGHWLGQHSMPEARAYSVVTAVHTLWLAARTHGLGVGWLSILDPDRLRTDLDVPRTWRLVAYLCVGWPVEEHTDPELERHRWQARADACRAVLTR